MCIAVLLSRMEGGKPSPVLQERRTQLSGSSFAFSITFVISTTDCRRELFADAKLFSSIHESQRGLKRPEHQPVRNECDRKCNYSYNYDAASHRSLDLILPWHLGTPVRHRCLSTHSPAHTRAIDRLAIVLTGFCSTVSFSQCATSKHTKNHEKLHTSGDH
ncbi:hypothetical protein ARMGADRAFT_573401 [Armillaria gallica]|uniref:Uncharacterized protein n=1 Tax=Armillaria gallica TaxID=47427 RepID=A0A2H3EAB0_ARMGA|nr:hypothetical protein ARMGADRAFT_573401 [Armillaria gallica]